MSFQGALEELRSKIVERCWTRIHMQRHQEEGHEKLITWF